MNSQNKSNLIIYQKYMNLIDYTNNIVRKYPKSETFALVKEIKGTLYSGLKLVLYAIKTYKTQDKLKYLNEFDVTLSLLKIHIRLSYKYKYISTQNYNTWCNSITEICNMLGGWINSCAKK